MMIAGILSGLVDLLVQAVQSVLDLFAGLVNTIIDAWPIGMPTLPDLPTGTTTVVGWMKWSPMPIDALLAFFAFLVTVWITWLVARPILRWLKVED